MTEEEKKVLIGKRLSRATESFEVAEEMYGKHNLFAVNRYYYAMFYAASGVLIFEGFLTKTHKGVITEFNRLLVKNGKFTREEGKLLTRLFQWRTKGDYDDDAEFTTDQLDSIRQPIRKFLTHVELYLSEHINS